MRVYGDTNNVYCFSGNCKESGKVIDAIDFVMLKEKLSKHEALKKCTAMLGGENSNTLGNTFNLLKEQLPKSKKAQDYLKRRGLENLKEIGSNHRNGNNTVGYKYAHLKTVLFFP